VSLQTDKFTMSTSTVSYDGALPSALVAHSAILPFSHRPMARRATVRGQAPHPTYLGISCGDAVRICSLRMLYIEVFVYIDTNPYATCQEAGPLLAHLGPPLFWWEGYGISQARGWYQHPGPQGNSSHVDVRDVYGRPAVAGRRALPSAGD
jgi:hypothetical protein